MKVTIAYTDTCLPDYFGGDTRPWVTIYPKENGYTSRELRQAILNEFRQGAIGGNDPIVFDYIPDEKDQKRAEEFYSKALCACLNRDIKYRGKRHKNSDYGITDDNCGRIPLLHIVFNIED